MSVIIDEVVSGERLENIEDILQSAWDKESPALIKKHGIAALQAASYHIRIEVLIDEPK